MDPTHRALAERGCHGLVVHADNDEAAARSASLAQRFGAVSAQHDGHFVIDELIDPHDEALEVAESPDRGLDVPVPR